MRIVFRSPVTRHQTAIEEVQPPPILTNRESDVLRELCRPLLVGVSWKSRPPLVKSRGAWWYPSPR